MMIGEVAKKAIEISAGAAKEGIKEAAKEVGSKAAKTVDISKRMDVAKKVTDVGKDGVDISKRLSPAKEVADTRKMELSELLKNYINDLKSKSDMPETIKNPFADTQKLEKISSEKKALLREEFDDMKDDLRHQWEVKNNKEWPRYKEDVFDSSGKKLRNKGDRYDAHHIKPLELNGENTVDNITPLDINKHKALHSAGGSYSKMVEHVKAGGKL